MRYVVPLRTGRRIYARRICRYSDGSRDGLRVPVSETFARREDACRRNLAVRRDCGYPGSYPGGEGERRLDDRYRECRRFFDCSGNRCWRILSCGTGNLRRVDEGIHFSTCRARAPGALSGSAAGIVPRAGTAHRQGASAFTSAYGACIGADAGDQETGEEVRETIALSLSRSEV